MDAAEQHFHSLLSQLGLVSLYEIPGTMDHCASILMKGRNLIIQGKGKSRFIAMENAFFKIKDRLFEECVTIEDMEKILWTEMRK